MKKLTTYFSKGELTLWGSSAGLILVSFFLFDRVNFLTLAASLIGTTSLIFNAKGNPIGQALMIVFSLLYGVISYTFSYFGEMINITKSIANIRFMAAPPFLIRRSGDRRTVRPFVTTHYRRKIAFCDG